MSDVLELSRFRVAEPREEEFLASYAGCARALDSFDGFRTVTLAKLDDGSYVFVGVWRRREDCERAMETATGVPEIARFLSFITEEIGMDYGDVVDDRRAAAAA